jgi:hypothetical protein
MKTFLKFFLHNITVLFALLIISTMVAAVLAVPVAPVVFIAMLLSVLLMFVKPMRKASVLFATLLPAFSKADAIMNGFQNLPILHPTTKQPMNYPAGHPQAGQKMKKSFRGTQSTIRCDVQLSSSGQYTFQLNQNQSQLQIETRLRQSDVFLPTKIGLFLRYTTSATQSAAQDIVSVTHTWPNPLLFTTATTPANLEATFNANLQVTINSVNVIEFLDTRGFRRVGIAQGLVQQGSGATAAGVWQADEDNGPDYGFVAYHPLHAFNGQNNNTIQWVGATGVVMSGTNLLYMVLMMRGVLFQNSAKEITDETINTFVSQS